MMWVLVLTGIVYLAFLFLHGEWRDIVPRRGDARDAWQSTPS
jgi:thiosulfate reductase cytochrome b subunit